MDGWTGHDDRKPRCPGGDGGAGSAVGADEAIARLLHSKISAPMLQAFRRDELFPKEGSSNTCGDSDGVSVVRRNSLTDDEVRALAVVHAARGEGRVAQGAVVATANDLRTISVPEIEGQLVFAYDDPSPGDRLHAVIRCRAITDRAQQSALRDMVLKAFRVRLIP